MKRPSQNIVSLIKNLPEILKSFLLELGFDILNSNQSSNKFEFIIVDDQGLKDLAKFSDLISKNQCRVVLFSSSKDYILNLDIGVRLMFDIQNLNDPISKLLLKRFFTLEKGIFIEESFDSKVQIKMNHAKIASKISFGHYADIISANAFDLNFPLLSLRSYFISLCTYFSYLHKSRLSVYPMEVNFGNWGGSFLLEINVSVQNFYIDYLLQSLKNKHTEDLDDLLSHCLKFPSSVEIFYNKRSKKLSFISIWSKTLSPASLLSIKEISTFNQAQNVILNRNYDIDMITDIDQKQKSKLELKEIEGKGITSLFLGQGSLILRPALLKRVINYCLQKLISQNKVATIPNLVISDIEELIQDYPNSVFISNLDESDKKAILKGLQSSDFKKIVKGFFDFAESETIKVKGGKDDFLQDLTTRIEDIGEKEIEAIVRVSGGNNNTENEFFKVKGGEGSDSSNESTLVKGQGEANLQDEHQLVRNWSDHKKEISEEIKQRSPEITKSDSYFVETKKIFADLLTQKNGMNIELASNVAESVMEESLTSFTNEADTFNFMNDLMVIGEKGAISLDHAKKMIDESEFINHKKLMKLKDIYNKSDKVKNEVIQKLKDRIKYLTSLNEDKDLGFLNEHHQEKEVNYDISSKSLEGELETLKRNLESKESQFNNYQLLVEEVEKNKNLKIEELKNKIDLLNKKHGPSALGDRLSEILAAEHPVKEGSDPSRLVYALKVELDYANKNIEKIKGSFEKLQQFNDQNNIHKNEKIAELERKIRESSALSLKEKMDERAEGMKKTEEVRRYSEVQKMQQSFELQENADKIKKLVLHNRDLEKKLNDSEKFVLKLQHDLIKSDGSTVFNLKRENEEHRENIEILKKYLLTSEAKFKQAELDLKRNEHKISIYEAKIKSFESALKLSNVNAGIAKIGSNKPHDTQDPKIQVKLKQMETANAKLTESNKKIQDDLNSKKTEILKLKQENVQIRNHLKALEKKSSNAKKAS